MGEREIAIGQIWRVLRTGSRRRITGLTNHGTLANPYYDVSWETVEKPFRRGATYQEYWLRNCEREEQG